MHDKKVDNFSPLTNSLYLKVDRYGYIKGVTCCKLTYYPLYTDADKVENHS